MPSRLSCSRSTSRVVPAAALTMARSLPASAFNRLDLPAFGRPTMATRNPSLSRKPRRASRSNSASSACTVTSWRSMAGSARKSISSSGKSIAASICTRSATSACSRASTLRENAPSIDCSAARAPACERDAIRSATASACARSSLPLRKARSVNSPGRASRAPNAHARRSSRSSNTALPCPCNSSTCSPVYEAGAGK